MNCPSRNDDIDKHPNWNQAPQELTADLTTRADLNGIANMRERDHDTVSSHLDEKDAGSLPTKSPEGVEDHPPRAVKMSGILASPSLPNPKTRKVWFLDHVRYSTSRFRQIVARYTKFIGPGFLIAVAYIDPGNYATDVNGKRTNRHLCLAV